MITVMGDGGPTIRSTVAEITESRSVHKALTGSRMLVRFWKTGEDDRRPAGT
jgi:hypothetical protein